MLDHCYNCGYSLDGLPDQHKCPECGFTYDRNGEVVTQAAFGAWAYLIFGTLALIATLSYGLAMRSRPWWVFAPAFAAAGMFAGFVLHGWRCLRRPNCAIFSRDGLALVGDFTAQGWSSRDVWQGAWTKIGSIRLRRLSSNVEICYAQGMLTLQLATDFFGTGARARRFVERANKWIVKMQMDADHLAETETTESEPRP